MHFPRPPDPSLFLNNSAVSFLQRTISTSVFTAPSHGDFVWVSYLARDKGESSSCWLPVEISSCSPCWIAETACESCKFGLDDLVEWAGLFAITSWMGCSAGWEAWICVADGAGVAKLRLTLPFATFTTCTSHCGWPPTLALEASSPAWKTAFAPVSCSVGICSAIAICSLTSDNEDTTDNPSLGLGTTTLSSIVSRWGSHADLCFAVGMLRERLVT